MPLPHDRQIFCILDGNAILHRAYHALPPLTTRAGTPVQAVYGYARIVLKVLREIKPAYFAATFDLAGPTFRHEAYDGYKATRVKTPDDLVSQFPPAKELTTLLGIPIYEKEGFEADDLIGTIVALSEREDPRVCKLIITGDLDTLQLVNKNTFVYTMKKGISEAQIYDVDAVKERFHLLPRELNDYKGLKGDPSDNIPGVKGIGEKTAQRAIEAAGSLEALYKKLEGKKMGIAGLSLRILEKLRAGREQAFFSRELATIKRDVEIAFELEACKTKPVDLKKVAPLLKQLEFHTLLRQLERSQVGAPHKRSTPVRPTPVVDASDITAAQGWFEGACGDKRIGLARTEDGIWICARESEEVLVAHEASFAKLRGEWEKLFSDPQVQVVCHGVKPLLRLLSAVRIIPPQLIHDTEIAAYLIDSGRGIYTFEKVGEREMGTETILPGGIRLIFTLHERLQKELKKRNLESVYREIELPLTPVLAAMEEKGVHVDISFLSKLRTTLGKKVNTIERNIYKLAGREFNINSPPQLSEVLFRELQLDTKSVRKTPGGALSTNARELHRLSGAHPIVDCVLQHRELSKLLSTYVETLPKLVNPATNRVHTTFIQTGAVTGRLASANPNLQNIPIRTETGRLIRNAFLASPGYQLVAFDYSQLELRIIAGLSGDEAMIEAFKRREDIHIKTAALVNKVRPEEVTNVMRRAAKTLNFGIIYGIGVRSFAESAAIPLAEAKEFFTAYFREFEGIRTYIARVKEQARADGYVATPFGRTRYLPELKYGGWQARQAAERMAVNMPIQGCAADLVKLAMIRVADAIAGGYRKERDEKIRMLLQVHDELLFEVRDTIVDEAIELVKPIMEGVFPALAVPLAVEVKVGTRWGEMHPWRGNEKE